jgi:glycosyltransferase involved in cell wall biosynthesis
MFKNVERPTVIVTAQTTWDEPPRMRHHIATQLSRHFNVIFCELNQRGLPTIRTINDSLIVISVGFYLRGTGRSRIFTSIFNKIQSWIINNYASKHAKSKIILLNFQYNFHQIYKSNKFSQMYLFINDDFVNMNPSDGNSRRREKQQDLMYSAASCDRIFASSLPLVNDFSHLGTPMSVIHSGHDFHPTTPIERNKITSDIVDVCFMGYIHSKLERSWLLALAAHPKVSLELIGPVEDQKIKHELEKFGNVVFRGPLVGKNLQDCMSRSDVFIMPYTIEPVNSKASVPAKLFQYLACGKPIVSSKIENLIKLPEGFVYFADSASDFVQKVLLAHEHNTEKLWRDRVTYAMSNTWNHRGSEIVSIINNDLLGKTNTPPKHSLDTR